MAGRASSRLRLSRSLASIPGHVPPRLEHRRYGPRLGRKPATGPELAFDGSDIAVKTGIVAGKTVNEIALSIVEQAPLTKPLFLSVHYMDVHHWQPWHFEKDYPGSKVAKSRHRAAESYSRAVRDSDRFLTSLLEQWNERRGLKDTLIVFYSDHGEHLVDPAVGHGSTMHDILLHVPIFIKYPKSHPVEPRSVDENISLVDITPTLLDFLEIPFNREGFSGRSLTDPEQEVGEDERYLFADFQLYGHSLSSIRSGPFKLIIDFDRNSSRLLDSRLHASFKEDEIVRREKTAELMRAFEAYVKSTAGADRAEFSDRVDRDEVLEALRSLGYVE